MLGCGKNHYDKAAMRLFVMIRVPRFDHRATDQSVGEHGFLMVETVEI
jgi:hypothetical protein